MTRNRIRSIRADCPHAANDAETEQRKRRQQSSWRRLSTEPEGPKAESPKPEARKPWLARLQIDSACKWRYFLCTSETLWPASSSIHSLVGVRAPISNVESLSQSAHSFRSLSNADDHVTNSPIASQRVGALLHVQRAPSQSVIIILQRTWKFLA